MNVRKDEVENSFPFLSDARSSVSAQSTYVRDAGEYEKHNSASDGSNKFRNLNNVFDCESKAQRDSVQEYSCPKEDIIRQLLVGK